MKNAEKPDHQTAESGGRAAGSSAEERRQPGESLSEVRLASAAKTEKLDLCPLEPPRAGNTSRAAASLLLSAPGQNSVTDFLRWKAEAAWAE